MIKYIPTEEGTEDCGELPCMDYLPCVGDILDFGNCEIWADIERAFGSIRFIVSKTEYGKHTHEIEQDFTWSEYVHFGVIPIIEEDEE